MLFILLLLENIENTNTLVRKKGNYSMSWFFHEDAERKPKHLSFHFEEKETLTAFFKSNHSLWNRNLNEYCDCALREALYDKRIEICDSKFKKTI